jgi:hypothetical protein
LARSSSGSWAGDTARPKTAYGAKTQPASTRLGRRTEEAHRASRGIRSNHLFVTHWQTRR